MFHIDSGPFKPFSQSPHCEVLSCHANISERFSRVWPGLFTGLCRLPTLIQPALLFDYPECLPPALIFSPNSNFDSALSTLCLKLVIEFCLSDLHSVLINLHMDPNATDSSLQKTSPDFDPAAFYHFTTEVSAQASVLATHQQQLNRLTSVTEELVKTLQALHLQESNASAPPPSPLPACATSTTASPRLAFPEKFDGSPTKCKGFLLQCSMFVNQQTMLYPTEESRIAFVCSLLTGRALDWATAVWSEDRPTFPSFRAFIQRFKEVFEHPAGGKEAGEQLLSLRQGRGSALSHFALSQLRRGGQTILSNFITVKAWTWSCSPNSPVATRESHWNNSSSCPSRLTTFSALVAPTVCPHFPS